MVIDIFFLFSPHLVCCFSAALGDFETISTETCVCGRMLAFQLGGRGQQVTVHSNVIILRQTIKGNNKEEMVR